jgi:Leucine-rich repeat (LRR) protein
VKISKNLLKPLEASPHYQYYSYFKSLRITIGDLKHLIKLNLGGCENLKELPQTIRNIFSLSILDLSRCKSIESLPTTIVHLKHLTELKLGGCENLKELVKTIKSISSLSILD